MAHLDTLNTLKNFGGAPKTIGLSDEQIQAFLPNHPDLAEAIEMAAAKHQALQAEHGDLLQKDEADMIEVLQEGYVNFYSPGTVNPYVALAAKGPWVITIKGAVLHDSGGYGMLGQGHNPNAASDAMSQPQVMANIMTPSFSHIRAEKALRKEIGHRRTDGCPYSKFMCLNSGSESVTLAGRLVDVNAKEQLFDGGKHEGRKARRIAVKGAFHGRTSLPALYSDSSRANYEKYLASFSYHKGQLLIAEPYNVDHLKQLFAQADQEGWFIEGLFLEPVMGEGDPGRALTPEFYAAARELTKAHGSLLLVDSIQAGLRCHGVLSVVDYPGFEGLETPDMETFSKALNAGQYPLSVLAVNERAAQLYRKGIYGNTMTTNPRALDVASAVLGGLTPDLRENIQKRGQEFVDKLNVLKDELGGLITKVQGTGLLFSCELAPQFLCYGFGSTEEWLRQRGIGVIHGGENSLRFTPHFNIQSDEVDLVVSMVKRALLEGPTKS